MFDFASCDVLAGAEAGRQMEVINPKTGLVWKGEGGTPVTITLLGRASSVAKEFLKQIEDERAAMESQGRVITAEMEEAFNARYLAALTRGWSFTKIDGADFHYTPSNAMRFWSDPRWPYVRRRALNFVASDGNFLAD